MARLIARQLDKGNANILAKFVRISRRKLGLCPKEAWSVPEGSLVCDGRNRTGKKVEVILEKGRKKFGYLA